MRVRALNAMVAICIILAVAGCGKKDPADVDCNPIYDRILRSQCMYNRSIALNNPTFCKDIPDLAIRTACIDDISIKLRQDVYCTTHERLSSKEKCEQKVGDAITKDRIERKKNESASK